MANQILGMAMQNAVWLAIWPIKFPGLYYALVPLLSFNFNPVDTMQCITLGSQEPVWTATCTSVVAVQQSCIVIAVQDSGRLAPI